MTVSISNAQGYVLAKEPQMASIAEVHGYVLAKAPSPIAVRQLVGYSAVTLPSPILARQIAGYALINDGNPIVGKNGRDAIFDAIMVQSKTVRPKTHFTLGQPEAFSYNGPALSYNARIKLTANLAAKLKGEMWFHYNRTSIAHMLRDPTVVRVIGVANTHALIPLINAATGYVITTDDIVDEPIPAGSDWFEVTAAATSHMFVPGSKGVVGQKPLNIDPWLLYDAATMTELKGRNVTPVITGAVTIDSSYLIDGEPTVNIPTGGLIELNLANDIFDSGIAEWTLEWSSRLNASTTGYANLMYLATQTQTGFVQRTSDSGFGLRIQQGANALTAGAVNNFPFGSAQKNGVLTRYAAVKKDGVIRMFVDGKPTLMANGTGFTYSVASFVAGTGLPITRLGFGTLAQNMGAVRLTKKALYQAEYTPVPLKPPSLPTLGSLIPVGELDGFQPQE